MKKNLEPNMTSADQLSSALTSEVARSAQLSVSEVLGVGKGSRWGANMGEQRGARHPPCHSSVHGCSPREAAAVPARINLGIVSGWRWR